MEPIDTDDLSKLYYTIGEVSEMLGISASLIRFWETEFSYLKPHKNSKGDRRFTPQNIEQLQIIHHLVKEKGFTLDGAKKEIKEQKLRLEAKSRILHSLKKIKKGLIDVQQRLSDEEE